MNENDIHYLEKALSNEKNEDIVNETFQEIDKNKENILNELELSKKDTKILLKKLEDYKYIDEFPDLQIGRYIRWINLNNHENIKLTTGGILCDIKMDDSIALVFKNNMNRFFQINMDEALVFQRLSEQERIILYAICYVNKSTK
jgi:hypothetical protein